jgi:hypothetical protein
MRREQVMQCYLGLHHFASPPAAAELSPTLQTLIKDAIVPNSTAFVAPDGVVAGAPPEQWRWQGGNQTEHALLAWLTRYVRTCAATALHCTALHCTALHCTAPHYRYTTARSCDVMYCNLM